MVKRTTIDAAAVINLCAEFLQATNAKSGGRLSQCWPHMNRRTDETVRFVARMMKDGQFTTYAASETDQNDIGRTVLAKTGMTFDQNLRHALKHHNLDGLNTLLGRAARAPA